MQFSTSAVLATMAMFAGQAFAAAQCEVINVANYNDKFSASGWCESAGRNRWSCSNSGTSVYQDGSKFTMHTGSQPLAVYFYCDHELSVQFQCPATVWGSIDMPCNGQIRLVYFVPK
ncbi:hypothetical protein E4U54_003462 [Claviceps lovelessii]|nr:hypothetical protein E4U54_003462 [Claviceps lovelessii]